MVAPGYLFHLYLVSSLKLQVLSVALRVCHSNFIPVGFQLKSWAKRPRSAARPHRLPWLVGRQIQHFCVHVMKAQSETKRRTDEADCTREGRMKLIISNFEINHLLKLNPPHTPFPCFSLKWVRETSAVCLANCRAAQVLVFYAAHIPPLYRGRPPPPPAPLHCLGPLLAAGLSTQ